MAKYKISAAIAAYNEEKNIIPCLESVKKIADEIVVVDGSSRDRTRQLAAKLGATVIKTTNKQMFHINKNLAIKNCHGEWIFLIDADERVSDELAAEIKQAVSQKPPQNAFWVNRKNSFLGGFLKKGGIYPDSVIRLFRKGKARLPQVTVHEQLAVEGEVGSLVNDLLHIPYPDFETYLVKSDRYTTETTAKISSKNPGRNFFAMLNYLIAKPLFTFINIYLRHKGWQDGMRGFAWALFSGAHHFYAYAKYWQKGSAKPQI